MAPLQSLCSGVIPMPVLLKRFGVDPGEQDQCEREPITEWAPTTEGTILGLDQQHHTLKYFSKDRIFAENQIGKQLQLSKHLSIGYREKYKCIPNYANRNRIVISKLLKRHSKVKCRVPAYSRVLHQIRGVVKRITRAGLE